MQNNDYSTGTPFHKNILEQLVTRTRLETHIPCSKARAHSIIGDGQEALQPT